MFDSARENISDVYLCVQANEGKKSRGCTPGVQDVEGAQMPGFSTPCFHVRDKIPN